MKNILLNAIALAALSVVAASAVAETIRTKSDLRIWQTAMHPTDPLSWPWEYPSGGCAGGTDPVGIALTPEDVSPNNIKRLVHGSGGYSDKAKLYELLPAYRNMYEQGITMAARFAIHLKPLNFGD